MPVGRFQSVWKDWLLINMHPWMRKLCSTYLRTVCCTLLCTALRPALRPEFALDMTQCTLSQHHAIGLQPDCMVIVLAPVVKLPDSHS